jgi:two-component system response regulator HydG
MHRDPNILLVDDDERLCGAMAKVLRGEGHSVICAGSASQALELLREQNLSLVISDLLLPGLDGIELLKAARQARPEVEVLLITGHGSVAKAVEAMRVGAYDFIEKPIESAGLLKVVAKALEKQHLSQENRQLRRQLEQQHEAGLLIGDSPAMQALKTLIRQIAPTQVTVLIQGESGTGKELVADAIHDLGDRAGQPLVKLSCAAIPETLLESELFGHERGAFTGAVATRSGKFEVAHGGTLLLDEIAEMSPPLQAKLLRVLQDGQFQRLGGTRTLRADVRLLAATHADLPKRIVENRFRHDLYYRLNTVQVFLPPLRDRTEDIPLLAAHFLLRFAAQMQRNVRRIAPGAMDQLLAHTWPGNVRELEHVIERAVALCPGDTIVGFSFAPILQASTAPASPAANSSGVTIPIGTPMTEATRLLVEATIEQCGGNKLQAARLLGIPPRTMYRHFARLKANGPLPKWQ